jgi:hypothetical protein
MAAHAACGRFRPLLVDHVDHGERGPGLDLAFDHLSACDDCRRELTELALTIAALRRMGGEIRAVPVPVVPAERLASAVRRRRDPWPWRLQLGGLIASVAIVAIMVAPRVGIMPRAGIDPSHPVPEAAGQATAASIALHTTEARIAAAPDTPSYAAPRSLPPRYPDGLSRPWKEVLPTDATQRELKAS